MNGRQCSQTIEESVVVQTTQRLSPTASAPQISSSLLEAYSKIAAGPEKNTYPENNTGTVMKKEINANMKAL